MQPPGSGSDVDLIEVFDITDRPHQVTVEELGEEPAPAPGPLRRRFDALPERTRWLALVVVAAVVGVIAGYGLGHSDSGSGSGASGPSSSSAPAVLASAASTPTAASDSWSFGRLNTGSRFNPTPGYLAVQPTGNQCGAQTGPHLIQVGVEIHNFGADDITLVRTSATFPLNGLTLGSSGVGTACGQLAEPEVIDGYVLSSGDAVTLLFDLNVLVACPQPYPVSFGVTYMQGDQKHVAALPGFPDLGDVVYTGCSTASSRLR